MTTVIGEERCAKCKFWQPTEGEDGICRRFPAQVLPLARNEQGAIATGSFFPPMNGGGWCGEYKMKISLQ